MVNADFDRQCETFLNWFRDLDNATYHSGIAIKDLREKGAGRGIVATEDIEPDTVLFTIPRNSIICAATSELPSKIPGIFGALVDGPDGMSDGEGDDLDDEDGNRAQNSWTSLILILMYERLRGDSSPWKPYLDVLPTEFDTLMTWSAEELSQLQASSVVSKIGREEADQMINSKIIPVIRAHEDVFLSDSQRFTDQELMELAHRMGSTIMAYAFDLEKDEDVDAGAAEDENDEWVEDKDGRTMMGMVPMADILNADAVFNAHISHGEDALTATSLRRIAAGEEILNYYGPLSNGELLRRYGYVTPKHAWFDVVELPWGLVEARMRRHLQLEDKAWKKLTQQIDPEDIEDGFVIEWGNDEPDSTGQLQGVASFHGLPDELGEQFKLFLKTAKKAKPEVAEILSDRGKRREELYLNVVLGALKDRESQYATTAEADQEALVAGKVTARHRMALQVRIGEKLLLREAQSWVERRLGELGGAKDGDAPAAKRQKTTR